MPPKINIHGSNLKNVTAGRVQRSFGFRVSRRDVRGQRVHSNQPAASRENQADGFGGAAMSSAPNDDARLERLRRSWRPWPSISASPPCNAS